MRCARGCAIERLQRTHVNDGASGCALCEAGAVEIAARINADHFDYEPTSARKGVVGGNAYGECAAIADIGSKTELHDLLTDLCVDRKR